MVSDHLDDTTSEVSESDDTAEESGNSSDSEIEFEETDGVGCSRADHSENNWLWERLAIICFTASKPLDVFKDYILQFIKSESDTLFNQIMYNAMHARMRDEPLQDAIDYALSKDEKSIIASVNKGKTEKSFWSEVSALGSERDCQWFTGKPCHCTECGGVGILKITELDVKIFMGMREDDLIGEIVRDIDDEVEEEKDLKDEVDRAVDRYKKDVLDKLYDAKKLLESHDWKYFWFF